MRAVTQSAMSKSDLISRIAIATLGVTVDI